MAQPKRKAITVRPEITTAEITVVAPNGEGVEDCQVELVGGKKAPAPGKTNDKGIFRALAVPGKYKLRVSKAGFGPATSPVVREGPFEQDVTLLPVQSLPGSTTTNAIQVQMALRNPRIIVHVFLADPFNPLTVLPDADVEVIGTVKGKSDSNGTLVSPEVPFGRIGINVGKDGFEANRRESPTWFQEVEPRPGGALISGTQQLPNRDLELRVELIKAGGLRSVQLAPRHPKPIAVWADGGATPHTVDPDPRLPSPGAGDTPQGQDGWDLGISTFGIAPAAFRGLAKQLTDGTINLPAYLGGGVLGAHQIKRLAIVAHGAPGIMDVDQNEVGQGFGARVPAAGVSLTLARIPNYTQELDMIGETLDREGVVYLVACNLADGPDGEDLLKALSDRWPTTKIVAIRSLGAVPLGVAKNSGTMFAGLRDTNYMNAARSPGVTRDYEKPAICNDLTALPWISETSPHATVALDGSIIRRGDPA
jgi:hypothetical protein